MPLDIMCGFSLLLPSEFMHWGGPNLLLKCYLSTFLFKSNMSTSM